MIFSHSRKHPSSVKGLKQTFPLCEDENPKNHVQLFVMAMIRGE
jgi:hypothetical protein